MDRRSYATLRKKLRELETKVVELLTLPPGTPHHDLISDGVEQRLELLKTLVAAEIMASSSSSPPSSNEPNRLLRATEKLSELEMAFREWDGCKDAAAVSGVVDDECSCSESNEPNGDEDDNDGDDIDMADLGFKVYDVPMELRELDNVEEEEKKGYGDEKSLRLVRLLENGEGEAEELAVLAAGKYYRVWATGVVLGALSMAVFMGANVMVRAAKKFMVDELEAMLDIVDPQLSGRSLSMKRRTFDMPDGVIQKELAAGVSQVVRMLDESNAA